MALTHFVSEKTRKAANRRVRAKILEHMKKESNCPEIWEELIDDPKIRALYEDGGWPALLARMKLK